MPCCCVVCPRWQGTWSSPNQEPSSSAQPAEIPYLGRPEPLPWGLGLEVTPTRHHSFCLSLERSSTSPCPPLPTP